jgi:hypothetical protein
MAVASGVTCETCAFYRAANAWVGRCARHAPRPADVLESNYTDRIAGIWPYVRATDWCGEWAADFPGANASSTAADDTVELLKSVNDEIQGLRLLIQAAIED